MKTAWAFSETESVIHLCLRLFLFLTLIVISTLSFHASYLSVPMVLLLTCLIATVAVKTCKKRLGIRSSQPTWFVFERLFPRAFPQVVGFVWACIGLIPVEFLIWLHGYLMHWSRKSVFSFRRMPGAEGMVALTIDDAIARGIDSQMMHQVLEILAEYNAKCSFFVVTSFVDRFDGLLREAVKNGHEICNHGGEDIPYHRHSKEEFRKILLECEEKIDSCLREVNATSPSDKGEVNRRNNKWFRPPHAKMSDHMVEVLDEEGFRIAMSDCYGMDVMCRPPFIANYTVSHAHPGGCLGVFSYVSAPVLGMCLDSCVLPNVACLTLASCALLQGLLCCSTCQRSASASTICRACACCWQGCMRAGSSAFPYHSSSSHA